MNNTSFRDLGLSEPILRSLDSEGFDSPTSIQARAIAPILDGDDVLGSAQTGSGKTAAFALPIIERLTLERGRPERGCPRALILAPTRELAAQIGEVVATFTRNVRISSAVIFGGVGKNPQISALHRGVDIVIATPGRLLDLMGEGHVSLERVQVIVLDEADRMLDMGFIPDVQRIIRKLPQKRQSLFFSATLPPPVVSLASELLRDPVRVHVDNADASEPKIDQQVLFVQRESKRDALRMLLAERSSSRALVFTRTKYRARDISRYLGKNGITASDLHGDKSQNARTRALADFHSGRIQVLVATDIASRGIDVDDIDHVINFELPNEGESYVHRIGRTARAGKAGVALSLCDESELDNLAVIQKVLDGPIPVYADHPYHVAAVAEAALRGGRNGGGDRPGNRSGGRSGGHSGGRSGGRGDGGAARGANGRAAAARPDASDHALSRNRSRRAGRPASRPRGAR